MTATSPARSKHEPRVEDDALVRGHGRFMDDPRLPNQAYAAFVRSPHAHARVLKVDTEAARKAKKVLAVLTAADMKAAGVGSVSRHPPVHRPRRRQDGDAVPPVARRRQGDACRRPGGDGGGGDRRGSARRRRSGAGRLRGIAGGGRPRHRDERQDRSFIRKRPAISASTGRARCRTSENATRRGRHHRQGAACGARDASPTSAWWWPRWKRAAPPASTTKAADSYTLHACSQGADSLRGQVAAIMGVPNDKLRVITEDVGGAFGMKTPVYPEYPALLVAAQQARPPGALDVVALGSLRHRHAGARHRDASRARARRQGQIPGAARAPSVQPGRLCQHRRRRHQHQQFRALPARHVPHPEDRCVGRLLFHQHDPDRPLSRRRTAGGELRARTRGRGSRAHHRHRPGAAAQEEPDPAIGHAVQDARSEHLRQRRLSRASSTRRSTLADYDNFSKRKREAAKRKKLRGIGISCMLEHAGALPMEEASVDLSRRRQDHPRLQRAVDRPGPCHRVPAPARATSSASMPAKIEHGTATPRWASPALPRSARARPCAPARPSCTSPT